MTIDISTTFGALLLGGFCAATLSGVVILQAFLYFKLFIRDYVAVKAIVAAVCMLDAVHSFLVFTSVWISLITNYGDETKLDIIPIPVSLAGLITAILTFIVHCFFSYRIHKLSGKQWQLTMLILVLALFRLCCATVTTAEMIHVKTFTAFKLKFRWILTLGLAMSTLVDILITWFLTHFLYTLQNEIRISTSMDRVIGLVIMYTFETNLLTSAGTTLSMVCWLTMPDNLTFLGLHFCIGKLYANSLLATLNARQLFQRKRQHSTTVEFSSEVFRCSNIRPARTFKCSPSDDIPTPGKLEVTVAKTVEIQADDPCPS